MLRTPLELTDGRVKPGAAQNRIYLEYEDLLLRKLTELDAVASEGSDVVRMRRKELVNKCQKMLGVLDQYRVQQIEGKGKKMAELGGTIKQVESSEKTSSNIRDEETTEEETNGATPNITDLEQEEPEAVIDESSTTPEFDEEMESLCSDTEDETEEKYHDDQDEGYYKSYCVPRPSHHCSARPRYHCWQARPTYPTRVRDSFFPRVRSFSVCQDRRLVGPCPCTDCHYTIAFNKQ